MRISTAAQARRSYVNSLRSAGWIREGALTRAAETSHLKTKACRNIAGFAL